MKMKIELFSRVHHKNIVSLVGFCFEHGEHMFVDGTFSFFHFCFFDFSSSYYEEIMYSHLKKRAPMHRTATEFLVMSAKHILLLTTQFFF
jgi:hypothetical protein